MLWYFPQKCTVKLHKTRKSWKTLSNCDQYINLVFLFHVRLSKIIADSKIFCVVVWLQDCSFEKFLYYIASRYCFLHYRVWHCTVLHYTKLHCSVLHFIGSQWTAICYLALHINVLYCTALHYVALCCWLVLLRTWWHRTTTSQVELHSNLLLTL